MKTLLNLIIVWAVIVVPNFAIPQALEYSEFKTNDEENNIEVFKSASPSVVHITNSRLVRSFYSLNPQDCLLYTSPSPRDRQKSRMPSSA